MFRNYLILVRCLELQTLLAERNNEDDWDLRIQTNLSVKDSEMRQKVESDMDKQFIGLPLKDYKRKTD